MIQLNGQNGGGQILRTALSLSMITGEPFHLKNIRGKRPKPGLMRQHLTCVQAAAQVSDASLDGAELHSRELIFHPGEISAGDYDFKIGTAGSTTLVAQTLLPALWSASTQSSLKISGGTHNPMAPSADFFSRVFLPAVSKLGYQASCDLMRYGFVPAGGGEVQLTIEPVNHLSAYDWIDKGEFISRKIQSIIAHIPESIGRNEIQTGCEELGWPLNSADTLDVSSLADCAGNVFSAEILHEHVCELITSFGAHGRSGKTVAREASKKMCDYLNSDAVVGRCLADQLLLPMALAEGGSLLTMHPSNHVTTNIQVIESFLDVNFQIEEQGQLWLITCEK